jgi:hypothetical protein
VIELGKAASKMLAVADRLSAEREAARDAGVIDEAEAIRNLASQLSEAARFVGRYSYCTDGQRDTQALAAAVSWVADPDTFATLPRILWTAKTKRCGKTKSMYATAALSCNVVDATGTDWAQSAQYAMAAAEGQAAPTMLYDDVSKIFGPSGTRGLSNPLYKFLVKGYDCRATWARSVDRQAQTFSIFSIFMMSGIQAAVPEDARDRCIVLRMVRGRPRMYFDVREAGALGDRLGESLGQAVRARRAFIRDYRVRWTGRPELYNTRLGEIWESLFAVAEAAGPEWRQRCMAAFAEVGLDETDRPVLSPDKQIIKDAAEYAAAQAEDFVGGQALAQALLDSRAELYRGRSLHGVSCQLREALEAVEISGEPVRTQQVSRVRGYWTADLTEAWAQAKPADADWWELVDDDDPWAVDDTDDDTDAKPQVGLNP